MKNFLIIKGEYKGKIIEILGVSAVNKNNFVCKIPTSLQYITEIKSTPASCIKLIGKKLELE